jgi:NodT family efflux transporter outer membrane factor (OMF) lipoprotein
MRYGLKSQLLTVIVCFPLAACTVGPDYKRPAMPVPAEFKELQGWTQARPRDHEISGNWWQIFDDPYLNALERQVDIANQSIAQAEAQFRQAQALVQGAKSAYFPVVSGSLSANRFRAASGQSVAVPGVRTLFNGVISFAWEPDIWGKVRREVESNEAAAQASAASLQAVRLLTQATLAQNYFQLRALDEQIKRLNDTVEAFARTLKITQNRYAVGVAGKSDVVQAETQLESARAQAIDIGVLRALLEHAIAVLMGKTPAELTIPVATLNANIPAIPVNIPSQLLERRPDIAEAERLAAAANARIGVAKAAYFPNLNLSGTNGYQASTFSNLLTNAARYWALGPAALALPLFDGGARGATLGESIHSYDASVAAYRQTVLLGFQEVEDQLSTLRILEQEIKVQEKAVAAARKAVELTTNQYQAGTLSYLNVMTAQTAALDNEITAVNLQSQRLVAAVQLIRALGGGWSTVQLPSPDEAGGETEWSQFLPIPVKQ